MLESAHMPVSTMDFSGMARLRSEAGREQTAETRSEVAAQFEALFVQMMVKSMRDTLPKGGLFSSDQMDMYHDMYDKQLSMEISRGGGLGLARMIEAQMQTRDLAEKSAQVSGNIADIKR